MHLFKILYTALFSLCIFLPSHAAPALKLRAFTMADGLPSSNITAYSTASNGMMWIATWNGLCNYDGYRFNLFVSPMGAGQVLTSNRLRFMVPGENGDVWITTFDNRLYLLSSAENRYIDYSAKLEELGQKDFELRFVHSLSNGAVWILGKNGVNIRVKDGKHDVVQTSRQADICREVLLASDGSEWMKGEKTTTRFGSETSIPLRIDEVFCTKKGTFVVGERFGKYDAEKEKFTEIQLPEGIKEINSSVQIGDAIVLATNDGLYSYSSSFRKINGMQLPELHKDSKERVWSLLDDGRAVMVSFRNGNVADFDVKVLTCSVPQDWPRLTADRQIVHEDLDGNLWVLLAGKTFCYYDEGSGELVPMDLRKAGGVTFPEMSLKKVEEDCNKNLWFNSSHNTYMLSFTNYSFRYVSIRESEETRAVAADRHGRFWAGTRQGFVTALDTDGRVLGYLTAQGKLVAQPARFTTEGVYSIYEDARHRLWIGTRGDGIFLLQEAGSENAYSVTHYSQGNSNLCGDNLFDINEDKNGRLWFGTYAAGLTFLDEKDGGRANFVSALNCKALFLPEGDIKKVRRISSAKDGTLLFSTADGLLTLNPDFRKAEDIRMFVSKYSADDISSLLSRDVMQTLICQKSERIYVATMGGGIQVIESANLLQNNLKFRQMTDIPADMGNIQSMIEDHAGRVWIVGENSVLLINADGSIGQAYSTNDLGRDVEFSEAKPCFNKKNNSIMLGTMGGVIIFRPDDIKPTNFTPSLVFSGIQYQGEEGITPLLGNREIELPTDKHNAVVYFSALDYSDNSKIRYAYRIKELEAEWSYVGSEHCAPLSNMPSGHYTLEVRSTNSDGIWVENNAELKIYVVPTFWQTPWAWVIYMLLIGLLLYGVLYLVQLREAHRMEKELHERQLRFFTDISHQLRTPLTLIGAPVTEVINTEKLTEQGKKYLQFVENNANKMLALVNKSLDLKKLQKLNEEISERPGIENPESSTNSTESIVSTISEDLTILIVEDNDELREFLTSSLSTHYNIIEAENGKVGLKLAAEKQPDFIITDIMMPVMDGITMIRNIKADQNISHIPIIILSARTADVYRIEGLKEGADDYITKPFSVSYLQVRVESIVRQRRMLQETWRKSLLEDSGRTPDSMNSADSVASSDTMASADTAMLKEKETAAADSSQIDKHFTEALTAFINENLSNENLKIDDIAHALSISRSVLYGKVKSIYGLSPNDVVRSMRLNRACKMLREDFSKTVAEIAYAVGFSEPKYFARSFKQSFGKTPTEFRKEL